MPGHSQGSASKAFQLDKANCGSSYIASLKLVRAIAVQNPEFQVREDLSRRRFRTVKNAIVVLRLFFYLFSLNLQYVINKIQVQTKIVIYIFVLIWDRNEWHHYLKLCIALLRSQETTGKKLRSKTFSGIL